jgi:hypothetical protein
MSLIDQIRQQLSPGEIQQISQQIGADPATTAKAIEAAVPMMVGGMASAAQQPGGASTMQSLMGSMSGAESLGGLAGALGGGGGLGGILGSMLGQHHDTVKDGVQQASGMDAGKVGKLLMVLAPFIIRALAKHQNSPAAQQSGGLGGSLQKEATDAMNSAGSPHVGGILGKILAGVSG